VADSAGRTFFRANHVRPTPAEARYRTDLLLDEERPAQSVGRHGAIGWICYWT
jgi:hypothetical protein